MGKFELPHSIETASPEAIRTFIRDRKNYHAKETRKLGASPLPAEYLRNMAHTLGESSSSLLGLDASDAEDPIVDTSRMTARFVITTASKDRHGDIVLPRGCVSHLKNYTRNPRVFFAHKTDDLPIASARDPDGNLALEIFDDRIYSTAYFHGETRESELIFRLVARKELQASSIGFLPIRATFIESEDEDLIDLETGEDIIDFRSDSTRSAPCLRFLEWDMIEWSIVPIPANQDALAAHLSRGHIDGEKISPSVRRALSFYVPKKTKTFVAFNEDPVSKTNQQDLKGSIENTNVEWDGLVQKENASLSEYKQMTAWFNGKDSKDKSSFKLPHHDHKTLNTIWEGVRTAMAALLGTQGGIEIPELQRIEVYNHLAKHYKEYYIPAPEYRLLYSIEELKTLFPDIDFKELVTVNTEQLKFKKDLEALVAPPTQGKSKKKKKEDEDEDKKKEVDEDDESAKKGEPEDDDDEVDVKDKAADDDDEDDDAKDGIEDNDDEDLGKPASKKEDADEQEETDSDDEDSEVGTKDVLKSMSELMHSMHDCSSAHTNLLTSLHDKMDHCMNALTPKEDEKPEEDEMKTILSALLTLKSNQDALNKRLFEATGRR